MILILLPMAEAGRLFLNLARSPRHLSPDGPHAGQAFFETEQGGVLVLVAESPLEAGESGLGIEPASSLHVGALVHRGRLGLDGGGFLRHNEGALESSF